MDRQLLQQDSARLSAWGVTDLERARHNLDNLAKVFDDKELLALTEGLARDLPRCADPDMALNNLESLFANPEAKGQLATLLAEPEGVLDIVLQLLSSSHFFSDLLRLHPEYLDILQAPLHRTPTKQTMQQQLQDEVDALFEDSAILRAFRRFRQRQLLRIGVNDIIRERPLEEITRDISTVAEVSLEVALHVACRNLGQRYGQPITAGGLLARCVILAFGKLGGNELNYSSDIDLMFVYDEEGRTRDGSASLDNDDYFSRVVSEVVRLLSARTDDGQAYRIDLRLRPEGKQGPLARSLESTLAYYDNLGRTWERQALIKVRPVAGDMDLGQTFLTTIEPFVYRKYLSFGEINEIKALKRQIERKAHEAGVSQFDVKTGKGGIRDIEFTLQFLQLLNGGDLPEVRSPNTLLAIWALEKEGCLTDGEHRVLDDSYRFLRQVEHRVQILFDLQTHQIPIDEEELRKLALRMGHTGENPREAFVQAYQEKTNLTRKILDHLLHQTFAGVPEQAAPESDLILMPNPDERVLTEVLGKYRFNDVSRAYHNLTQLAHESVPFLSTRRCRHFLASIAPDLLRALAETPDPDMALTNLEKVSHSLGCKAVLWELFNYNPPSLRLYVDLCAWSQFLSEILITNPGMIDELLDSLVLNQPRTARELREELDELCRGATDLELILHSFQDKELLRIGVRDILNKDTIQETTSALSDLAETILCKIAETSFETLVERFGKPHLTEGGPCRYALIALGKLGGHEMNYHSDLDLLLLYEGDGETVLSDEARLERRESTDNLHFFTEYAQRIIKTSSTMGPMGRLYEVDMRLRPHGRSANLALPLAEFRRYFEESPETNSGAGLWERQMLTRARVVVGDREFVQKVYTAIEDVVYAPPWQMEFHYEMRSMRTRMEETTTSRDLKRGPGGLVDVEFLVQMYQLKFGRRMPSLRTPRIWLALNALREVELLDDESYTALRGGYDFLLRVQSRLRIVHNLSLNEVPESPDEMEKLARRLGFANGPELQTELERHTQQLREVFARGMEEQ